MPYATAQDGVRLYFEECGTGPAVVLVHEFAGDLRSYEPQMRALARTFRCIAFNARGFPPSDVPTSEGAYSQARACADIVAVIDHCDITDAHLIGVSMGAYSCLFLGLDCPDRVRSAVVAGCGFAADPKLRETVRQDIEAAAARIEQLGMPAFADTYTHGPARIQFKVKDPRGWAELRTRLADHSGPGAAMTLRRVQKERPSLYDLAERFSEMTTPVLIVTGDEDEPCLEPSLFLKRTLPNSGLAVVPFTGHTVNLEEPDKFNRLCREFFEAVDRGTRSGRHELAKHSNAFGMR
jgi:pimeloyl-ACP methyl ester carboxylesterase